MDPILASKSLSIPQPTKWEEYWLITSPSCKKVESVLIFHIKHDYIDPETEGKKEEEVGRWRRRKEVEEVPYEHICQQE